MFFKKNKELKKIVITTSINLILILFFFGIQTDLDTSTYVKAIEYLKGNEEIGSSLFRLLKPFGLYFAIIFSYFTTIEVSLLLENIIFYFAASYLMYLVTLKILGNKKTAFYGLIFFITAYPLMRWGIAALTDMSGWFFYILIIYLSLLFYEKRDGRIVWLSGFFAGIGMFFKETAGVGSLYFGSMLLLDKSFGWIEKIKNILKYTTSFLSVLLPISLIILYKYNYSFLQWFFYAEKIQYNYSIKQSVVYSVENLFALMFLGWIFVIRGLVKIIKDKKINKNLIWAFILPSISFVVWPFRVVRLMFIAGPFLCILAGKGLEFDDKKKQYLAYGLLAVAISFNYFFPKFVDLSILQDLLNRIL